MRNKINNKVTFIAPVVFGHKTIAKTGASASIKLANIDTARAVLAVHLRLSWVKRNQAPRHCAGRFAFLGRLSNRFDQMNVPALSIPARPDKTFFLEQAKMTAH